MKFVANRLYEVARKPMATAKKTGQLKPMESRMRRMAFSRSCRSCATVVSGSEHNEGVIAHGTTAHRCWAAFLR